MVNDVQLYKEAGQLYCKVAAGVCNLKNGLFQSNFKCDLKKLLAIVGEAIKNKFILIEIYNRFAKVKKEKIVDSRECKDGSGCKSCWTKVQIYDMLFGQANSNTSGCPLVSKMREFKNIVEDLKNEKNVTTFDEVKEKFLPNVKEMNFPVYVRINLADISKVDVIDHFTKRGYNYLDYESGSVKYNKFLEWARELQSGDFMPDFHLSEQVLVFASDTSLYKDKLIQAGSIVVQDKSSCIPPMVVAEKWLKSSTKLNNIIDACAAPGNKTAHLLSLLRSYKSSSGECENGKIFAFDRDKVRCKLLKERMSKISSTSEVVVEQNDFTNVNPTDSKYKDVTVIMVDPSCSGTGMVRQIDRAVERSAGTHVDPQRLSALRSFQLALLRHAMKFPKVQRIVYSTCSITLDENELMIEEALQSYQDGNGNSCWQLTDIWRDTWMTRGKKGYDKCVRTNSSYDLCTGFFVACLDRNESIDPNTMNVTVPKKSFQNINNVGEAPKKKRRKKKNKIDKRNRVRPEVKYAAASASKENMENENAKGSLNENKEKISEIEESTIDRKRKLKETDEEPKKKSKKVKNNNFEESVNCEEKNIKNQSLEADKNNLEKIASKANMENENAKGSLNESKEKISETDGKKKLKETEEKEEKPKKKSKKVKNNNFEESVNCEENTKNQTLKADENNLEKIVSKANMENENAKGSLNENNEKVSEIDGKKKLKETEEKEEKPKKKSKKIKNTTFEEIVNCEEENSKNQSLKGDENNLEKKLMKTKKRKSKTLSVEKE